MEFGLDDSHRLPDAAGQRGEFRGAEDEQHDGEDDDGVPAGEVLQQSYDVVLSCGGQLPGPPPPAGAVPAEGVVVVSTRTVRATW